MPRRRKNAASASTFAEQTLDEHIETMEAGYEYLLAYAAQGKDSDHTGSDAPSEVRTTLRGMSAAAAGIIDTLRVGEHAFHAVVVDDAGKSKAAIELVLAQAGISSELVDNLNASIHLRALLTDLFLLSESSG